MVMREIDMSTSEIRSYPLHVATEAGDIEFRMMGPADEALVLEFAQRLPEHDLLFLPRNISEPKVLSAWIKEIERGSIISLLAVKSGRVVGCGTIVRDPHSWSPHVGEIRNVVSPDVRGLGGWPGAVAGNLCARFERRPGKAAGPDDGRSDRRHRDLRRARVQGRGAAARPCPRSRRQKARYCRARA